MTDKIVAMDIETESLTPDKIWCICAEDVQTGEKDTRSPNNNTRREGKVH